MLPVLIFTVFALVLAGMYLSIRRRWLVPGLTAGLGVLASVFLMTLFALAQNNGPIQAIIVGVLLGAVFSGATLAIAWYFHSSEMRAHYADGYTVEESAESEA